MISPNNSLTLEKETMKGHSLQRAMLKTIIQSYSIQRFPLFESQIPQNVPEPEIGLVPVFPEERGEILI